MQAEDEAGEGGFAAAAFADDAETAAGGDAEGDAVDGADHAWGREQAGGLAEDLGDVADFDRGAHRACSAGQVDGKTQA